MFKWLRKKSQAATFQPEVNQFSSELNQPVMDELGPEYVPRHQRIEVHELSAAEYLRQYVLHRPSSATE